MENLDHIRNRYTPFDRPEILQVVFYPSQDFSPPPPSATDHLLPVEHTVSISARLFFHNSMSPTILYFHGNGEVSSDYDAIAPYYHKIGCNLLVADYRGYGKSGGRPSFATMATDAHAVFKGVLDKLSKPQFVGSLYIMGRSLGSVSALELASTYPEQIKGLIIESGFASITRLLEHLSFPPLPELSNVEFPSRLNAKKVTIPTLIIHGENDFLIPLSEAQDLYTILGSKDKDLLIIPRAGHNDIMLVGWEIYFAAIKNFVSP